LPLADWFVPPAFRRGEVTEKKAKRAPGAAGIQARQLPERTGYVPGIPQGGINEYTSAVGASTGTDRRSMLQELYDAYVTCPWAWTCVQAIARTVTAGGLVTDWDADTGEGDQEEPEKPPAVVALERFYGFCNPTQDIRQLLRNVVADLLVFGDALLEVVWSGPTPVALYNLDVPSTFPEADEHGNITGYVQVTDLGQRAEFEAREVIHISLDSARPGVFGVPPTQAMLNPITSWLFAAATEEEMLRKGLPVTLHADLPASYSPVETERWRNQTAAQNLGSANIGVPYVTKGGGKLEQLQGGKLAEVLAAKSACRDEIVAGYGVPPAEANIIESGNLGGGTGDAQHRSFHINTCDPIAAIVLEKLNFHIAVQGFGVRDWHSKFGDVDYRDSLVVEQIRDMRLRNGAWILNRYKADIGEPPVPGGDDAVLVDRQNLVLWADMAAMSKAMVAGKGAPAVTAGEQPPGGEPLAAGQRGAPVPPGQVPPLPAESLRAAQITAYQRRLREAMRRTAVAEATQPDMEGTARAVYDQLARDFPPEAIAWVREAGWEGPLLVDADQIDTSHKDSWRASHDGRVPGFREKLRRKLAAGKRLKPVVLVRVPGSTKDVTADGHHRVLASIEEGEPVYAYVGRVSAANDGWRTMHNAQYPEHVHDTEGAAA
jgi:hypothetical protein